MSSDAWDTVAVWIGTVGTGGGFLIAAFAYLQSVRDRRRAQAKLVSANLTSSIDKVQAGDRFKPDLEAMKYRSCFHARHLKGEWWVSDNDLIWVMVTLTNGSNETVTDVRMSAHIVDTDYRTNLPGVIDSPPGHKWAFDIAIPDPDRTYLFHRIDITVEFTDAGGTTWRRSTGRPLRKIRNYSIKRTQDLAATEQHNREPQTCPSCGSSIDVWPAAPHQLASATCTNESCTWTRVTLG